MGEEEGRESGVRETRACATKLSQNCLPGSDLVCFPFGATWARNVSGLVPGSAVEGFAPWALDTAGRSTHARDPAGARLALGSRRRRSALHRGRALRERVSPRHSRALDQGRSGRPEDTAESRIAVGMARPRGTCCLLPGWMLDAGCWSPPSPRPPSRILDSSSARRRPRVFQHGVEEALLTAGVVSRMRF